MAERGTACSEYGGIAGGNLCSLSWGWRNTNACQYSCWLAGQGYTGDTCNRLTREPGACFDQIASGMFDANHVCDNYPWGVQDCNRCSSPGNVELAAWQPIQACAYSCDQAGCGYDGQT